MLVWEEHATTIDNIKGDLYNTRTVRQEFAHCLLQLAIAIIIIHLGQEIELLDCRT